MRHTARIQNVMSIHIRSHELVPQERHGCTQGDRTLFVYSKLRPDLLWLFRWQSSLSLSVLTTFMQKRGVARHSQPCEWHTLTAPTLHSTDLVPDTRAHWCTWVLACSYPCFCLDLKIPLPSSLHPLHRFHQTNRDGVWPVDVNSIPGPKYFPSVSGANRDHSSAEYGVVFPKERRFLSNATR